MSQSKPSFYMRLFRIKSSTCTFLIQVFASILRKCLRPNYQINVYYQGKAPHTISPADYSVSRTSYSAKHAEDSKLFGMRSTECGKIQHGGK